MSNHLRLPGIGVILVVAAVILITCSGGDDLPPEQVQITVEQIINQVETESLEESSGFLPAQVGQDLNPGDGVKTLENSQARVDIAIGELIRITRTTPNSIWRLGQFVVDENVIIELDQGKLFLFEEGSEEGSIPVDVVTPAGIASARGTWMSVEYDPISGVVEVECFRGVCGLENDQGLQLLTDEQKSTATADTTPTEPEAMSQDEVQEFNELPEVANGEVSVPTAEVPSPTLTTMSSPTPTPMLTTPPAPAASPTAQVTSPTPKGETLAGGSGATHYVDPSGADTNSGSAGSPWRTLQHAVDSVSPGDIILVNNGVYSGMRIEKSGEPDAWITLKAESGATVLINAPGPENRHDSNIEVETWEGEGIVAYWIIEGLEVAEAPNWGIDLRGNESRHSHHFVISENRVHNNGLESGKSGIFTAFVDDIIVEYNESYDNGEHGVYLSNSGDRFVVRNNRLHHNTLCGLHMNGDAGQGGDGVIDVGTIEANTIYENGVGGCSAINMDGVTNAIVRNNLLYMNHAGGISLFQQDGALCSQNNQVLNNTIVMAKDGRWAINISDESCINNRLLNNIIYSHHDWRGSISIPSTRVPGFESDHNLLMDRMSIDDGDSVISLAEWQSLGYDLNSSLAAPEELFVDLLGNDYRLRADSPAVDAGLALFDIKEDIEGNPRPQGESVDIGAFEHDGARAQPQEPASEPSEFSSGGVITYSLGGRIYRLQVLKGAAPEDVSLALDGLAPGQPDAWLNVSPDGEWLVLETDRFDSECQGWACLAVVAADISTGEVVRAGEELIHPQGFSAIASGGNRIIYPDTGGPHELDLWAVERQEGDWRVPVLLTGDSLYSWNYNPAISADGRRLVFNCGDEPYGALGTAICEVDTDGRGFQVLLTPDDAPVGLPQIGALYSPDYAPDGSVIFEADWDGEQIWKLAEPGAEPERLSSGFNNDNSPCVLFDGIIVSLWLDRPNGPGLHEIKVMAPDGSEHFMLLRDADVEDVGIGCGG